MDDLPLIELAASGDEKAEAELFRRHVERIHRVVFRMTGDASLTDDLTQDTFVRAFERLGTFRGQARFSTWLTRIAMTVTLNELARNRTRRHRELPMPHDLADVAPSPRPFIAERIEVAMRSLPDRSRAVLAMYVEGYSHGEIAAALGITVAASKTRLSRARAELRETLGDILEELRT